MPSVPPDLVRAQLGRILASRSFAQAERLRNFLRFVVEASLDGKATPKEYVIAVEVCRRPPDFDPAADPIVRVDASRLRGRLKAYYENEGRDDPVIIAVPKGLYEPRFEARAPRVDSTPASTAPRAVAAAASLAVLPFVNLRADAETDFFSDGLTEELINLLSRIAGLRVVDLDPISPVLRRDLGVMHYLQRDYRQAETDLRESHDLEPGFVGHWFWLARTLAEQGRFDEAEAALDARSAMSANTRVLAIRAHTYARMGRLAQATQCVAQLEGLARTSGVPDANLAIAYAALGRRDAALAHLATAVANRSVALFQIAVDPVYDPLRGDPRFDDLLRRMNLPRLPLAASARAVSG